MRQDVTRNDEIQQSSDKIQSELAEAARDDRNESGTKLDCVLDENMGSSSIFCSFFYKVTYRRLLY